ncbi:hypothetical protein HanIR_Chr10g0486741 [Helianthus annuus]|nr:hypothetical protein HanIR_Chr10g0486741 [Helianthus annuus]
MMTDQRRNNNHQPLKKTNHSYYDNHRRRVEPFSPPEKSHALDLTRVGHSLTPRCCSYCSSPVENGC